LIRSFLATILQASVEFTSPTTITGSGFSLIIPVPSPRWASEKMTKRDSGVVVRLIVFMQITGGQG
jgi:hypothetical protein